MNRSGSRSRRRRPGRTLAGRPMPRRWRGRGHRVPAAANRRFVAPADRRRQQDLLDANRMLAAGRAVGVDNSKAVHAAIASRGSW